MWTYNFYKPYIKLWFKLFTYCKFEFVMTSLHPRHRFKTETDRAQIDSNMRICSASESTVHNNIHSPRNCFQKVEQTDKYDSVYATYAKTGDKNIICCIVNMIRLLFIFPV